MFYKRIKGGEKNTKSGVRWSKDEILEVYKLFKEINGVGLHEHNPEIQKLALRLGRTVRSTEAQTLMFRNLERSGIYSHGNMNKLTREVWIENETDVPSENIVKEEIDELKENKINYDIWNKLLVNYYFKSTLEGQEIGCFPVSNELFEEITNYEYTKDDFFESIRRSIGTTNFFDKLENLYKGCLPREYKGKKIRKPLPDYFGFLIFLIYALSEDNREDLTAANVYDRINHFGFEIFKRKWKKINSTISRNLLELTWEHLEEWSLSWKKGLLGQFVRRDPKNLQRCYVSRIERHSLFNSKQFSSIIDYLISEGYRPESNLSVEEWLDFFSKYDDVPKAKLIIEYISDGSPLQGSVLVYLNSYLKTHYNEDSIGSEQNKFRTPPIKMKICLESLPPSPNSPIDRIFLRAYSDGLEDDIVNTDNGDSIKITPFDHEFSEQINYNFDLESGVILKSERNRYTTSKRTYWLSKNHNLNEWVEVNHPSNERIFLLVIKSCTANDFKQIEDINCVTHPIKDTSYVVLHFNSLSEAEFDKVYNLYNPSTKIKGKIELVSDFVLKRRTCLFLEFDPLFRYIGPTSEPRIIVVDSSNKNELCVLETAKSSNEFYKFPKGFVYEGSFQVKEANSKIKTRYNLKIGSLNQDPINIKKPYLKNHEGRNDIHIERHPDDIYDIPVSFNREFDVVKFNGWHNNLFNLFKAKSGNFEVKKLTDYNTQQTSGDKLLQFVAISKSITTYGFPKLIRELDPEITPRYSKRLMDYWRHLGYINFQDYGEQVKVNPPSLFFLQTSSGLKALLTGFRNKKLINALTSLCYKFKVKVGFEYHCSYKENLHPTKIVLYDSQGDLNKFKIIGRDLGFFFVNDIQNPLNPKYVVYQLSCFYTQRSVVEFNKGLLQGAFYEDENGRTIDHFRKRVYNNTTFRWQDSNEDVKVLNEGAVVRYDGFRDRSMTHIVRFKSRSVLVKDVSLAIFASLDANVLFKDDTNSLGEFNLFVRIDMGLPFWIERGLILLNGDVPSIRKINDTYYRIYEKVNSKIIDVIEEKLDQKINKL